MVPDTEILLLGPLVVRRDGEELSIGGRKAKVVLGTLLVGVNHAIPADQIMWALWGRRPPESAVNTVQTYVSRLRNLLGPNAIKARDHSYVLVANCQQVDSCRFERMVSRAETTLPSNPDSALEMTRAGLGLWRGPPFGDLASEEFAQLEAIRLNELRLNAVETEIEAELLTGREHDAVARLQALVREHPLRENFWHLLVRGLGQSNRRPEALAVFDRYRAMLRREGLEPNLGLEELLAV